VKWRFISHRDDLYVNTGGSGGGAGPGQGNFISTGYGDGTSGAGYGNGASDGTGDHAGDGYSNTMSILSGFMLPIMEES